MFVYQDHKGPLYASEEMLDEESLFCEACFDSDILLGEANTREEAVKLLENKRIKDEEINKFVDKYFPTS